MAVTATPVFVQTPKLWLAKITPADTTTLVTLISAGADGSKILGISIVDGGVDAPKVTLWITRSAVDYILIVADVPEFSGVWGTVPAFDVFGSGLLTALPVDNDGQRYLFLESGDTLKASVATTLGTGDVHLTVIGGSF